MEQAKYMISPTAKIMKRFNQQSYSSRQDQEKTAFIQDAVSGALGCIWPPRSYTCSFCKRDFRSAQALGGHMNVHRRDRALLKQVTLFNHHSQNHGDHKSLLKSMVFTNPSQVSHPRTSVAHLSSPTHNSVSGFNKVISSNDVVQVKIDDHNEEKLSCKRFKKSDDHVAILPLLFFDEVKPSNFKGGPDLRSNQAVINGLDLELRLGDPPNKVLIKY